MNNSQSRQKRPSVGAAGVVPQPDAASVPVADVEEVVRLAVCACREVRSGLRLGFDCEVYKNALALELRRQGLFVELGAPIRVAYRDCVVGSYLADMVVEGSVLIAVKTLPRLETVHHIQLSNQLAAGGLPTGLLVNFGAQHFEVKRKFHSETLPQDPSPRSVAK